MEIKKLLLLCLACASIVSGCHKVQTANPGKTLVLPQMVDIPGGEFLMGCVSDINCRDNELPVHRVKVEPFKLARTEVTFKLWDACVDDGACSHKPDHLWVPNKNTGPREHLPVMLVSFYDITEEFIPWLNRKTGLVYRLPSEAEWEYAARAGAQTPFNTGECLSTNDANFNGRLQYAECPLGAHLNKAMPVGSYPPNAFGLYDMHGNVWEWVEDCWNSSETQVPDQGGYDIANNDSSAVLSGDCSIRVLRGGAWNTDASYLRLASRDWYHAGLRFYSKGFRLAMSN